MASCRVRRLYRGQLPSGGESAGQCADAIPYTAALAVTGVAAALVAALAIANLARGALSASGLAAALAAHLPMAMGTTANLISALTDGLRDAIALADRQCAADPVDVVTGDVVLSQTDLQLPGILPLVLSRAHVSSYRAGRWFGRSSAPPWTSEWRLTRAGYSLATDDGRLLRFPVPPNDGSPVSPIRGPRWGLRRLTDGYAMDDPRTGQSWWFRTGGPIVPVDGSAETLILPLTETVDRHGNRIDVVRAPDGAVREVRHRGGYRVRVDTASGRITALWLCRGQDGDDELVVRFGYDPMGNLTQVIDPAGRARGLPTTLPIE